MAEQKKQISKQEEYQRYLDNKMTPQERHAFEKRMLEDPFEAEAMEGLSDFSSKDIQSDLTELRSAVQQKSRQKKGFVYWRAAAAILLLSAFSFVVYFVIDNNSKTESFQTRDFKTEEQTEQSVESPEMIGDSALAEASNPPALAYKKELDESQLPDVPSDENLAVLKKKENTDMLIDSDDEPLLLEPALEEMVVEEIQPEDPPEISAINEAEPISNQIRQRSQSEKSIVVAGELATDDEMKVARAAAPRSDNGTKTITGKITSIEDDEALPGVNVIVKGTTVGTVSDIEGNYSIKVPEDGEVTLVYSSVGFTTEEIKIGEQTEVDVNVEPDVTALSEIVVTGYATQRKSDITGAASEVEMDEPQEYNFLPPLPAGGKGNFKDFVKENIHYPDSGLEEKIKGTVKLKFAVRTNGSITNMEVLKSLGEDFDQEAIRLVKEGPDWEPAELNGEVVEREVKVKIRFRPPN